MDAFKKIMHTSRGKKAGWKVFCTGLGVDPEAITAPFLDHIEFAEGVVSIYSIERRAATR